ncbi:MAG: hypothetical protein JXR94_14605 [Candidatus Hydrogenedentes bacterium]|nr:hypothetical protein [Candidatus Hydrogenedentota bacterium]
MKHIKTTSRVVPLRAAGSEECMKCLERKDLFMGTANAMSKCNNKLGCTFV